MIIIIERRVFLKFRVATVEELEQKYILVPDDVSCEWWEWSDCTVHAVCLFVCLFVVVICSPPSSELRTLFIWWRSSTMRRGRPSSSLHRPAGEYVRVAGAIHPCLSETLVPGHRIVIRFVAEVARFMRSCCNTWSSPVWPYTL